MKIGELLQSINSTNNSKLLVPQNDENSGKSFASILNQSLHEVNETQVKAYDTMEALATGKVDNLQEAIQKIEEAELSLKIALEVKNKALSAYKEVMRMQV